MSTLAPDDLPEAMARHLVDQGADTRNDALCKFTLLRQSELLEREIDQNLYEAMAIAEMARNAKRDLEQLKADLEAEMRR